MTHNNFQFPPILQENLQQELSVSFEISPKKRLPLFADSPASGGAEWSAFADWLDSRLDEWGLDAPLYSRCVFSILRQPYSDDSAEAPDSEEDDDKPRLLPAVIGRRKDSLGYSSTDTSTTSLSGNYSAPCLLRENNPSSDRHCPHKIAESKKTALMECLKTVELDQKLLKSFVNDVWNKYEAVKEKHGLPARIGASDKQNDSVDSGVCPSPIEEQNYDQAFPPLSEKDTTPRIGETWQEDSALGANDQSASAETDHVSSTPIGIGRTTAGAGRKLFSPGVAPFTTEWAVHGSGPVAAPKSCPDRLCSLGDFRGGTSAGSAWKTLSLDVGGQFDRTPHFVMPKLASPGSGSEKVGSCPTRLEFCYSGPPASADLTEWLCAQFPNCESHAQLGQPCTHMCGEAVADWQQPPTSAAPSVPGVLDVPRFLLKVIDEDNSFQHQSYVDDLLWQNLSGSEYDMWGVGGPPGVDGVHNQASFDFCVPKMGQADLHVASVKSSLPPTSADPPGTRKSVVAFSEQTHFKPIKCESMEAAYNPARGVPPDGVGGYATEHYENEEYYVLRQPTPVRAGVPPVPEVRSPTADGRQSLPLKFKAERPHKEVQTDKGSGFEEWLMLNRNVPGYMPPTGKQLKATMSDSLLAHISQVTHMPSDSAEMFEAMDLSPKTRTDRVVFLASGYSVWDQRSSPVTSVEEWTSSHLFEANRPPASVRTDYSTDDHDKSLDEDDLLLKYVDDGASERLCSPVLQLGWRTASAVRGGRRSSDSDTADLQPTS